MAVGPLVRRRREELNLSQGRVAQLAGVSQGYLSKLELGSVRSPGVNLLYSLAAALELDTTLLLEAAGYRTGGNGHRRAQSGEAVLPAWWSWLTRPPCLARHSGWVCPACRQWPEAIRSA